MEVFKLENINNFQGNIILLFPKIAFKFTPPPLQLLFLISICQKSPELEHRTKFQSW